MTTVATETKPAKKQPRSTAVTLHDASGATLTVRCRFMKDATARTHVVHSVKDAKGVKTNQRGASGTHATVAEGLKHLEAVVAKAIALGWVRKQRAGGFAAAPDVFALAALPKPVAASKRK